MGIVTADGGAGGGGLGVCNLGSCTGKVLYLVVLGLGQGIVMGRVALLVLAQRESVSIAPSFLLHYDDMVLALISERLWVALIVTVL